MDKNNFRQLKYLNSLTRFNEKNNQQFILIPCHDFKRNDYHVIKMKVKTGLRVLVFVTYRYMLVKTPVVEFKP